MNWSHRIAVTLVSLPLFAIAVAVAADVPDTAALLEQQRTAMKPFARFDGVWRGHATIVQADGQTKRHIHTERVGSLLGDTLKVIEGRSYNEDGSSGFNAFAVISFDPPSDGYRFHSYAQGRSGDFEMVATPDGYVWSIPAGPVKFRYTAHVKDGEWSEIGERLVEGQPATRIFEMRLKRVGDTDWPGAGPVPMR